MGHCPSGASECLNDSHLQLEMKNHLAEYRKAVGSSTVYGIDPSEIESSKDLNARLQSRVKVGDYSVKHDCTELL